MERTLRPSEESSAWGGTEAGKEPCHEVPGPAVPLGRGTGIAQTPNSDGDLLLSLDIPLESRELVLFVPLVTHLRLSQGSCLALRILSE